MEATTYNTRQDSGRMNMTEFSPPYLHTRYLSTDQQARCERNPTYAARLASLRNLRQEVEQIRGLLTAQDLGKRLEFSSTEVKQKQRNVVNPREIEKDREAFKELERKFMVWDDECAGLAEALLMRPKFRVSDEVECIDGRWYWRLPQGALVIPRHAPDLPSHAFEQKEEPSSPAKRLSRSVSKLLHRSSKDTRASKSAPVSRSNSVSSVF